MQHSITGESVDSAANGEHFSPPHTTLVEGVSWPCGQPRRESPSKVQQQLERFSADAHLKIVQQQQQQPQM